MVLVDGLQVAAPGKGPVSEITVPPKACRCVVLVVWVWWLLCRPVLDCLGCLPTLDDLS